MLVKLIFIFIQEKKYSFGVETNKTPGNYNKNTLLNTLIYDNDNHTSLV